jgi:hypothetical protein
LKPSSAKAKGQRLAKEFREMLLGEFQLLAPGDIRVTPSGVPGEDILLSPKAEVQIPFSFECKNRETLNIWKALKQADKHAQGTKKLPAVVFRRNNSKMYVALEANVFIDLVSLLRFSHPINP